MYIYSNIYSVISKMLKIDYFFNINCEHYLYPTLYNLDSEKKCNQNLKKKYLVKKQKLKCRYQI